MDLVTQKPSPIITKNLSHEVQVFSRAQAPDNDVGSQGSQKHGNSSILDGDMDVGILYGYIYIYVLES